MKKTVRFYQLKHIASTTVESEITDAPENFWTALHDQVLKIDAIDRRVNVRSRVIYGEAKTSPNPAQRYFYIGGLRSRAEWPDSLSAESGSIGELRPEDDNISLVEPAYVVPFGYSNQIAMLNMSAGSPRVAALESWVTAVVGRNGYQGVFTLLPIINSRVQQRLAEAVGATKFTVKVQQSTPIPEYGGGTVGQAARAAKAVSTETDIELGWSLANRKGSSDTKGSLLAAARWIRDDWVKSASVNLELPDGEHFKRLKYDLIKEQFTSTQRFEIRSDSSPSELSVLTGINQAIESFRAEFS